MLTIKNKHAILGLPIYKTGFVIKDIDEVSGYRPNENTYALYYDIKIHNNKDTQSCLLNRNKIHIDGFDWYELTCIRNGKIYREILMLRDIKNKRWFIDFVSKVTIE